MAKNTICLWYDKDAEAAARFYAETFPNSAVGVVHRAPSDYPSGKEGDVLTVEFTVAGVPCIGLNGGPAFKHNEAFSFQIATDDLERHCRQWRPRECVRLVQGQVGRFLANHAARADRGAGGRRRRSKASIRCHDGHEENRRRRDQSGAARLILIRTSPDRCLGWAQWSRVRLGHHGHEEMQRRGDAIAAPHGPGLSRMLMACNRRVTTAP